MSPRRSSDDKPCDWLPDCSISSSYSERIGRCGAVRPMTGRAGRSCGPGWRGSSERDRPPTRNSGRRWGSGSTGRLPAPNHWWKGLLFFWSMHFIAALLWVGFLVVLCSFIICNCTELRFYRYFSFFWQMYLCRASAKCPKCKCNIFSSFIHKSWFHPSTEYHFHFPGCGQENQRW